MISEVTNEDCMIMMSRYPDKFFDLAIVDPPYGIGFDGEVPSMINAYTKKWKNPKGNGYSRKEWDNEKPSHEYFFELMRICDRLIIWGGNYFTDILPISGGWTIWDKKRPATFSLSQAELAWRSFGGRIDIFEYLWNGFQKQDQEERIHPTQKPIALYNYCLSNYAKPGDKILDTHLGSGSSRIAAYKLGFDFWGCELDKDYFDAAEKRFKAAINEPLFQTQPEPVQKKIFE